MQIIIKTNIIFALLMTRSRLYILLVMVLFFYSCKNKTAEYERTALLEVEGKFLYKDQVNDIIPPNLSTEDSIQTAERYIRKWVTDVLVYENAKRNISNTEEINQLLEDYKKSLIIHQYQQKLINQRLPKQPREEELLSFYDKYSYQFTLDENLIKGILLVVPTTAPQINNVRSWVKSANIKSLENIEKYSLKNAISYDYFANNWVSFLELKKKIPIVTDDAAGFITQNTFVELEDSTKHYFLKIVDFKVIGDIEPFENAKPKIINLILNKLKAEFIINLEKEIYNDAIKNETVFFFED